MINTDGRSPIARIFKIVGYATALLTLVFGLSRAWVAITDYRERQQRLQELLATAEVQMIGADYSDAWKTVSEAETIDPSSDEVRRRREDISMAWLRDANAPSGQTFSDMVSPLIPVVTRGVTLSEGVRRADLLAHIGWADFLRWRDGGTARSEFDRYYREALALDPANPYANAFAGHWALWPPSRTSEAIKYFEAGLAGGRERAFIRRMQLAGLKNSGTLDNTREMVRMAADLVSHTAETPGDFADTLWRNVYQNELNNRNERLREVVLDSVAPPAHIAVFESFFGPGTRAYRDHRWERDLWLAYILDRAGRPEEAVELLVQTPKTDASGEELPEHQQALIAEAIARFSASGTTTP